jgi:hypothetical protein
MKVKPDRVSLGPTAKAANDNWPLAITREQAADMAGISMSTFDSWVRKGILPKSINGTRRWSRTAIERALAGEAVGVAADTEPSAFLEWRRANAH